MQPVSDSTRNLAKLLSEALNSNVESANESANKSANKSANSADNSDVNLGYFSKLHEQIISVMDNGKEYTTENIATLIGLKGPRTRQLMEFDISRATVFRDYAKIKKITGAVYDKNESVWKL